MTSHILLHDAAHLWHPDTQHLLAPLPRVIARAEGAWLYDEGESRYLDATSSWFTTVHGHCHEDIVAAITEQAATLDYATLAGTTNEPAASLAAALASRLPRGLTRVHYADSASSAVDIAIQLSTQSFANNGTPRRIVAALKGAYHGRQFGLLAGARMGDSPDIQIEWLPAPHAGDTLAAFTALLESHADNVAALIVEPLLHSAGGFQPWSEELLRELRRISYEAGVHLIADETLTGFGRTGPLFACDRADITPDILCMSHALTGGTLPLAATATTERIYDAFLSKDHSKRFLYRDQAVVSPISCAAALASLELFDEDSEDQRIGIEVAHARHLEELAALTGVHSVRQLGTVAAIQLDAAADGDNSTDMEFAAFALQNSVLLTLRNNIVVVAPPYCTDSSEIDHIYSVIQRFIAGERSDVSQEDDVDGYS